MSKDYEMLENVMFDQVVKGRLIKHDCLSVAFRDAWRGKACIRSVHGHLQIFRAAELTGYPYALTFEDLMASDWTVA